MINSAQRFGFCGFVVETMVLHDGRRCLTGTQTVERLPKDFRSLRDEFDATEHRANRHGKAKPKYDHDLDETVSNVETLITDKFGQQLTHAELLTIAKFVSDEFQINIDRDATRKKSALLKWCALNYTEFTAVLQKISGERESCSDCYYSE